MGRFLGAGEPGTINTSLKMSSSRRYGKKDILNKKVPENPKYKNVKATVDTGASVTRYMERIEEMRKNYKFKKDEIFKRMKVSTFAQLVLQVANVVSIEQERLSLQSGGGDSIASDATLTQEREERESFIDENMPPLHLGDDGDNERPDTSATTETSRSTLQSVIHGVGELDLKDQGPQHKSSFPEVPPINVPEVVSLPYLLLDVRDKDAFNQCHIIGAMHYPVSMLSRSCNYFTQEILIFKNKLGKIIILYDEDERLATSAATTFVQREVDNVFMLSGGLKVLAKKFPEGLITGTLPVSCKPTPPPTRRFAGKSARTPHISTPPSSAEKAGAPVLEEWFTSDHLEKIDTRLNEELISQDSSSRLSSRVSSRSTTSAASRVSSAASTASKKPSWK